MKEKSGLKQVIAKWVIRISNNGEIKVKKGDEVKKGEVVAEVKEMELEAINAANIIKGWSEEAISQLRQKLVGSNVKYGEVLVSSGGWGGKRILANCDGVIEAVDEFGQIHINKGEKGNRCITAPVTSKVTKMEDGKITLSFEAYELTCGETGKSKVWGNGRLRLVKEASRMKSDLKGKIIFTNDIDAVKLIKAEAIGVAGIIVVTDKSIDWNDFNFELPVVTMAKGKYSELLAKFGFKTKLRLMLNSNTGRVLVVVQ